MPKLAVGEPEQPSSSPRGNGAWISLLLLAFLAAAAMAWSRTQYQEDVAWEQAKKQARALALHQEQARQATHFKQMAEAKQALQGLKLADEKVARQLRYLDRLGEESLRIAVLRLQLQHLERQMAQCRQSEEWQRLRSQAAPVRDELFQHLNEQARRHLEELKAARKPMSKTGFGVMMGISLAAAWLMTQPAELRHLRAIQLVLLPSLLAAMKYVLVPAYAATHTDAADMVDFLGYLPVALMLAILLGTNIAYYSGRIVQGIIDPHDWTPAEEELALAPIRRLIQDDRYTEALKELEKLLAGHKPSYEALLLKAKLLYHFGQVRPARQALLSMLRLTRNEQQQTAVMQGLRELAGASKA